MAKSHLSAEWLKTAVLVGWLYIYMYNYNNYLSTLLPKLNAFFYHFY